ncbi:hypothetical protein KR032_008255 [Drosophila birchii]|nr:hypothetical protein KR032_008255 [Drosophila birchii]
MRLSIVILLSLAIWLCCLTSKASAVCCKPSHISFELADNGKGHTCGSFGGKKEKHGNTCTAKICGNGDRIVGTWCGRGRCNPRGCHCKKGCLPGNAVESFRNKHGFFNFVYVK